MTAMCPVHKGIFFRKELKRNFNEVIEIISLWGKIQHSKEGQLCC